MRNNSIFGFYMLVVLLYVISQPILIISKIAGCVGISWFSVFLLPLSIAVLIETVVFLICLVVYSWKEWRTHE